MSVPNQSLQAQLEERVKFETLLADLSARFVGLPADALDQEIEDAQRRICEVLGLDRSTLGQFLGEDGMPAFTHSWAMPGFEPNPIIPVAELLPWLVQQIRNGHMVQFSSVDELPKEAETDKQTLRRLGPKSNVTFPLVVGGKVLGSLSFGTLKAERQWPSLLTSRLRLVAEIFANALTRRRTEQELRQALADVQNLKERLQAENISLRQKVDGLDGFPEILGRSKVIQQAMALARQVASTDSTVLLLGETGTGKELLAAAIHDLSTRHTRPMVRVNCAAIPASLVESELFGRERGAYTGALTRQIGRFEAANASTILLDEIGELPPEVQAKLLRVLQDHKVERLGSSVPISVNVRVIAATNSNLEEAVSSGKFRRDLYYRLNVFPIRVPPLRSRPEDIPILVSAFANEFSSVMGKSITTIPQASLDALKRYSWPGNVRELRNVIERAVILSQGPKLVVELPETRQSTATKSLTLQEAERDHILRVLQQTAWRLRGRGGAAEILGLKRTTLQSRMAKLGIRRPTA